MPAPKQIPRRDGDDEKRRGANLTRELKAAQIDIKFFDVGGGLGIIYGDESEPDLYEYAVTLYRLTEARARYSKAV